MKDNYEPTVTRTLEPHPVRPRRVWTVLRLARALGVGVLAGLGAGAVGGAGARLAMRISGAMTGPECARLVTENGNDCGVVTPDGTLFLVIFGAMLFGIGGGAVYASLQPWLARFGRRRGLVFGLLLFAIGGTIIVDSGNEDFHRFGTPVINVLVFFLLFPLFGVVVANVHDRLDRRFPKFPPAPGTRLASLTTIAYIVVIAPAAISLFATVGLGGRNIFLPAAALAALGLPPLAHHELHTGRNRRRAVALAILASIPYAIGAVITARSVIEIL
ncbi:MAG: hypothetical protein WD646_00100 [Actinomycetota bacterium]